MWICKNCQNQNEENFKFCWSCGNSKSASRITVRGNTTELSPSKGLDEKEIPPVNEIKTAPQKPIKKVELQESIDLEVRTKEKPLFDETKDEVLTQPKPIKSNAKENIKTKEKRQTQKQPKLINEPEIFSTFSPKNKNAENGANQTNWEKEIFTIAVRLIGLYFIYLVIIALPDIVSFLYSQFTSGNMLDGDSTTYLLSTLSPLAKYLFYLVIGIYLISSGKLLIRLLRGR